MTRSNRQTLHHDQIQGQEQAPVTGRVKADRLHRREPPLVGTHPQSEVEERLRVYTGILCRQLHQAHWKTIIQATGGGTQHLSRALTEGPRPAMPNHLTLGLLQLRMHLHLELLQVR